MKEAVIETLKKFIANATSLNLRQKRQNFSDLTEIIKQKEIADQIVGEILKLIVPVSLLRFQTVELHRLVSSLIDNLSKNYPIETLNGLSKTISKLFRNYKQSSQSSAKTALTAWKLLLISSEKCDPKDFDVAAKRQLTDAFSACAFIVLVGGSSSTKHCALRKWRNFLSKKPLYAEILVETLTSDDGTIKNICLLASIFKVWKDTNSENVEKYFHLAIEFYVKNVLSSKGKTDAALLECCQPLFCLMNHDSFQKLLLPHVQKYLLRNPEFVIEAVGFALNQVPIDLSQYALDLCKPLAIQLFSKESETRDDAAVAIKSLARQCSDAEIASKLVSYLFSVLNGSEGKLTNAAQRIGVINGIQNLSYFSVSGSKSINSICNVATDSFITLLKEEVHEGTLQAALQSLTVWACKFQSEFPTKLTDWFKEGLNLKTTTHPVRNAYLRTMNASYHGDTLQFAEHLIPVLLSIVEKASKQPSQFPLVLEALPASVLLLKLSSVGPATDSKLKPFWTWIVEKKLFSNDNFLETLDSDGFLLIIALTQKILLENADKINEANSKQFYRLLLFAFTHRYHSVRLQASNLVKKLLSTLSGAHLCHSLIVEFKEMLLAKSFDKLSEGLYKAQSKEESSAKEDVCRLTSPKILCECFLSICKVHDADSSIAVQICLDALYTCCHPRLSDFDRNVWLTILKYYSIDPREFTKTHRDQLLYAVWNFDDEVACIAANILALVGDDEFYKALLKKCWENVPVTQLNDVVLEDVLIMNTPEGVLYDKSVLEAGKPEEKQTNIKRESKLYSYKEQMAALALKKELEEKMRKEGKLKVELTPKQKEAMQQQLTKESLIRKQMFELWNPPKKSLRLIKSLINGNQDSSRCLIVELQKHLWPLLKSPLAASIVVECILELRNACFSDLNISSTASALTFANLRFEKVACDLDPAWCQESPVLQAKRALNVIFSKQMIRPPMTRQESDAGDNVTGTNGVPCQPLPSPTFGFCFPLIKHILIGQSAGFKDDEEFLAQAADFCCVHVGKIAVNKKENFEVSAIPFVEITDAMFSVVGTTNVGSLQQAACSCLVELASTVAQYARKLGDEVVTEVVNIATNQLLNPSDLVREYSLKVLEKLSPWTNSQQGKSTVRQKVSERLWIARFDVNEINQQLADKLWQEGKYSTNESLCQMLLENVLHHSEIIRESASESIVKCLELHKSALPNVLTKLSKLYTDKLEMTPPVYDDFGRLIAEGGVDQWEARAGIAITLRKVCPLLTGKELQLFFSIILPDGLNDRSADVAHLMLLAAVEGVKIHGKEQISKLLPMFDKQLDEMPDERKYDTLRQSIVVLLGTLAQHLEKDDPKVKPIVAKLIEALSTPAQLVQQAVANCLPPLVPAIKEQVPQMVEKLLCLLLEANQYGERRGAAYGLAGLVKGMGILSLRQLEIMTKLNDAMTDKKVARHREGALLALEMLCNMLGKLFEPYVVHVLPNLLLCFGDPDQHVREAADECAKAVMRHLSAHGVKLVLPALLTALEEDSWRTKCGSVELLGAMAYCAPKQLSSCLPSIVPKLIEVLSDTHMRVQKAGEQALKHIGQVIKNPEIQALVNVLLGALEDPAKKTASCLQTLLHTKFVHYIDAPSLALIMPVIHRAFDDRSTETRRSAAQIVGNIYSLTDQKDVEPYLPQIMPGLKKCLLDPVPEVRGVAAKALGSMVAATGEANFQDLVPWLQTMLTSPNSSVDRSGAAQGLSEVIGGLGESQLQTSMPDIIHAAESPDVEPHVRDGYIMMYIYLPSVFGERFLPYLSKIIPSILTALAEENEYVRETALRSGQRIINMYCESAIPLLLPSLERGLFDDNWRIRYSSVQLLGDLLFKISGVTGKMSTESGEDDTFGTEASSKTVLNALGLERRNRVLAGLYISRSDVALMVRQAAGHVWKVIVSNTPKTLKEILPTLFHLLLGCLASSNYDKQQVAARSLGELVKKMGERILVDVVPVLEHGLKSDRADQRQGVCIALSEIMANTTKETVLMYSDNLIPSIRSALSDPLPEVRRAAASTFSVLHSTIGPQAMDDVLTPLLALLEDEKIGNFVLDGLQQVMAQKNRVVLPYMVPKLTTPPVNTKALSHLASVAGDSLNKHLNRILTALISSFSEKIGTNEQNEEMNNCAAVLVSVKDDVGVATVIEMLLQKNYTDESSKIASAILLSYFCQNCKAPLTQFIAQLIRGSLNFYTSENEEILTAATEALNSVVKSLDGKEQIDQINNLRQTIKSCAVSVKPGALLPGFCRDKSVQPVLTVFREGVLNGGTDMKELAAYGLSETIMLSDAAALKPHVVNVTGPLIRVLGDRYPPNVKSAILATLALLLEKVGILLKPFLPQLQSTFVKALNEPASRTVRLKASKALAQLMFIHPKADTVLGDLCKNAKSSEDVSIRETYLIAIRLALPPSADKLSAETKSLVESTVIPYLTAQEDNVRIAAGAALGTLVAFRPKSEEIDTVLKQYLLNNDLSVDWQLRHACSVALQVSLKTNSGVFCDQHLEKVLKTLSSNITADRVSICNAGLRAAAFFLRYQLENGMQLDPQLSSTLARSVNHQSNEIKQLSGDVFDYLGRNFTIDFAFLKIFVPSMVNGTKEKNSAVRSACEQALISLLRIRQGLDFYNNFLNALDTGARDSLSDVYTKNLQKLAKQAEPPGIELDDTVQA